MTFSDVHTNPSTGAPPSTQEILLALLVASEETGRRMTALERGLAALGAEVDRMRVRVTDPASEEMNAEEAGVELGLSAYTVRGYARRYASDPAHPKALRGFKVGGRGEGEWRFTRTDVEAFKRARRGDAQAVTALA